MEFQRILKYWFQEENLDVAVMHQNEIFIEGKKYSFGKKIHFKGLVHPKKTRETTAPTYFCWNLRALRVRPSIDSKGPYTIKVQKRSKDIGKIIHVTSGVKP